MEINGITIDTLKLGPRSTDAISIILSDGERLDVFADGVVQIRNRKGTLKEFNIRDAADKMGKGV